MKQRVRIAGEYELVADLTGVRRPPVVFVSGLGEAGKTWQPVLHLLDDQLLKVTYDRAGLGESQRRPDSIPVPYSGFATELHDLLTAVRVRPPWIFVAHSFGGSVTRALAHRWPHNIAGLVLVDVSLPQLHLLGARKTEKADGDAPFATRIDLIRGIEELEAENLPAVPAIVLTKTPGHWPGFDVTSAQDAHWQIMQRELARKTGAMHIVAQNAGHRLHEETPQLVACAITAVHDAASNSREVHLSGETIHRAQQK